MAVYLWYPARPNVNHNGICWTIHDDVTCFMEISLLYSFLFNMDECNITIKKMYLWNTDAPGGNKVKIRQNLSKFYILILSHPCDVSQVWATFRGTSSLSLVSVTAGITDRRTDDPITRCPRRTFQAGHKIIMQWVIWNIFFATRLSYFSFFWSNWKCQKLTEKLPDISFHPLFPKSEVQNVSYSALKQPFLGR